MRVYIIRCAGFYRAVSERNSWGSMVGGGGAGGSVATNNSVSGATAGANGLVIQTLTFPTALF